ncbi:MAG TPA: hypothetical protein VN182_06715 [Flavobacterium sp.]|nr:hypothetical protein [Flavobacterium sp.]
MTLPKIKDIYSAPDIWKADALMTLMNQPPKNEWVKEHPFVKNHKYLPIERVEYLLKTIFKRYKIEITGQGTAFNGVWVTVRIHYQNPLTGDWDYNDGIGAAQLQTAKGTSPADLVNINNGALSMAFPIAKTLAVKDAADHFGKLFGSDLNRKDVIQYETDLTLIPMDEKHPNWEKVCKAVQSGFKIEDIEAKYSMTDETKQKLLSYGTGTI